MILSLDIVRIKNKDLYCLQKSTDAFMSVTLNSRTRLTRAENIEPLDFVAEYTSVR